MRWPAATDAVLERSLPPKYVSDPEYVVGETEPALDLYAIVNQSPPAARKGDDRHGRRPAQEFRSVFARFRAFAAGPVATRCGPLGAASLRQAAGFSVQTGRRRPLELVTA